MTQTRESLVRQYWGLDPSSPSGLRWIKRSRNGKRVVGDPACVQTSSGGYWCGQLGTFNYSAHRVVYLLQHGHLPKDVDHRDGNRKNNALDNLRDVTRGQNMQNKIYTGCYLCKCTGRWRSEIRVGGKRKRLGRFSTQEEAHAAYLAAKRELHPYAGERCYA